jgi:AraC-like DNA-binding protein
LEDNGVGLHKLPFYADGYPGLMYSECADGVLLQPNNKKLSELFLYGQTIEPIELHIKGQYKLIVFQLYPFATRLLLNIDPKEINDECFDLNDLKMVDTSKTLSTLKTTSEKLQVKILSDYILQLVKHSSANLDNKIKLAVSTLISSKGTISITDLRNQLYITERTFERKFTKEIGVTPKQFAKIIQFSYSLNQLQESDYYSLTDVAYNNNFSDQSHFIRTFKKYAGQTPKEFSNQIS